MSVCLSYLGLLWRRKSTLLGKSTKTIITFYDTSSFLIFTFTRFLGVLFISSVRTQSNKSARKFKHNLAVIVSYLKLHCHSKFSQNAVKIQSKFSQNSVKMQAKFRQNAGKMQAKCRQNVGKMQPNCKSKCSQNSVSSWSAYKRN